MQSTRLFGLCQLTLFILSITGGLMVGLGLGWAMKVFSGQCPLYAKMVISRGTNGTLIMKSQTQFGGDSQCLFAVFCPIAAVVYNIIWLWFYVLLYNFGMSLVHDENVAEDAKIERFRVSNESLLLGTLLALHSAVTVCLLVALGVVQVGISDWCSSIMLSLDSKTCSVVEGATWSQVPLGGSVYGYLHVAKIGSWLILVSTIMQLAVCSIRLRVLMYPAVPLDEDMYYDPSRPMSTGFQGGLPLLPDPEGRGAHMRGSGRSSEGDIHSSHTDGPPSGAPLTNTHHLDT